jgi:hypothetical protein
LLLLLHWSSTLPYPTYPTLIVNSRLLIINIFPIHFIRSILLIK